MISRLSGILIEKNPPGALIDVQGVGYELDVPMSTFYNLPAAGERVTLLTHLAVREDGHFLYGFLTREERAAFRQLLKISGIGARMALAVLSGMSVGDLAQTILRQDTGPLVRIPGIGKKTAERLLLELKGKLGEGLVAETPSADSGQADILNALLALGYNDKEARQTLKSIPAGSVSVEEGIRLALKSLSKA